MKNYILRLTSNTAAIVIGVAFIISVIIVTIVDDFLLSNFVVPGDVDALAYDIENNRRLFGLATIGYFIVLILDSIIGLALYVVFKHTSKNLATLTTTMRLLYAFILLLGLFALAFHVIDAYGYATIKLVGYLFFALHIFTLGCVVLKSDFIPKFFGALLILASFTYITFFVDFPLPELIKIIFMLTMAIAELALSIWLMIKRNELPKNI